MWKKVFDEKDPRFTEELNRAFLEAPGKPLEEYLASLSPNEQKFFTNTILKTADAKNVAAAQKVEQRSAAWHANRKGAANASNSAGQALSFLFL